ncbi:AMP-dependent synthetase and ligase [Sulfobacillus acidophilus TPY]|uniref:acetate--CoA ligase n=1 Tax=Sulfobacillus acidophilus (strain ATCC 700253 / DSM 10332 / NAL) TaxID=679936 RepID=G8TVX6_SULAD|nr:AMP-dependent synthetase and ligase [Sulfobacillus acidophilus TPY]AEW04820.1 Acetate--CoA ligase [Sulfobacillus acidophilus DSM 10332]
MELWEAEVVWRPTETWVKESRLGQFLSKVGLGSINALRERAASDPEWFWDAVVKELGWPFPVSYQTVLDTKDGIPFAEWFVGGRTNVALAALDRHRDRQPDRVAVIYESEAGQVRQWTYGQLGETADRLAHGLRRLGIGLGDRIGIYLPMIPEAVALMMAAAKIGAIIVPAFSGYGAEALATRLADAAVSLLVTADGYFRRGRWIAMKPVADQAIQQTGQSIPILLVRQGSEPVTAEYDWETIIREAEGVGPYRTEILPSETPLMIIYTSGTTGRPKGAVHTHTGFPLKASQDLWQAFDLRESDRFFWFTDLGWMMGPWMIYGGLITGSTLVLYDGTPDYPDAGRLWDLIDRHQVSVFGISPTAIRALMAHGRQPLEGHSLQSLRILGSSGEPWNPEPWLWFFRQVGGGRCPIVNYSGGTEISGGIVAALAVEPQKPCAFSGPIPGMVADVVNEEGQPVVEAVGELVLRAPWPGMTRGFWHDRDRYQKTYWSRFPGLWVHGDFAYIDRDGFWYILGRSDDTIKVAGKRLGPAEVESIVVAHPEVVEAAAIGVPDPVKGEALVVVAVVTTARPELTAELSRWVEDRLGKALKPKTVILVPELPKTRNGKIVRRVIKAQYLGQPLGDTSSVENVQALDYISRGDQ